MQPIKCITFLWGEVILSLYPWLIISAVQKVEINLGSHYLEQYKKWKFNLETKGRGGWNLSELVDAFFVHKITTTLLIVWFTPMWYFLVLFLHLQTKEL